jgi:branched-chain amino acid transport system ATP-binding protein
MAGLEIKDLKVGYKRNQVIHGVDIHVEHGERVAMLGANGAGKSTILKAISGLLTPTTGSITFDGDDLTGKSPSAIVNHGVVQVPEGRRVFPGLDVEENLRAANYRRGAERLKQGLEAAYAAFPILEERRNQPAGLLSGGQQQMLSLARAIIARPRLLLIDEMSLGLAPVLVKEFYDTLGTLFSEDVTLFLVEQNAGMALAHCERFYVIRNGEIALEGKSDDYVDNPTALQSAYLGI